MLLGGLDLLEFNCAGSRGIGGMSRRVNGTNRAAALTGGSRYTGYTKPIKKTASLTELNGRLTKKLQLQFNRSGGKNQDEK